jgi:hypothetical protein
MLKESPFNMSVISSIFDPVTAQIISCGTC